MPADRLARQIAFIVEADRLKSISRRTPLVDGSRLENSAEHSWHLALAALVLREYAAETIHEGGTRTGGGRSVVRTAARGSNRAGNPTAGVEV